MIENFEYAWINSDAEQKVIDKVLREAEKQEFNGRDNQRIDESLPNGQPTNKNQPKGQPADEGLSQGHIADEERQAD